MHVEDEAYGRFLGVPEADLCWYEEDDMPDIPDVKPLPAYIGLQASNWPDMEKARLSPWISRPTSEGVERTISIGQAWHELAERLAEEVGYTAALRYAETQINRTRHPWYRF